MTSKPFAAPVPRVPRSRRDDRFEAGYPPPPKRAAAGYVVSVQDEYDTVTVDVLDEELTGVIPLGDMPPVGAIVEVESRGDLLVIPTWFEGPPPPPTGGTLDIPATFSGGGIYTTTVGGSTCVSVDDGDTSYLREYIAGVGGGTTGYNDHVTFPAASVPGDIVTSVELVTVTKGVGGEANTTPTFPKLLLNTGTPDFETYVYGIDAPIFVSGSDWTETVIPLTIPVGEVGAGDEWITKERIEAGEVEYNPGYALMNCTVVAGAVSTIDHRWTYMALRVTYE